jgi:aminopeptidase-like protein
MKPINTVPIEMFLEKARIAIKSGQKQMNIDIKDVIAINDSIAVVMTRLAGKLDEQIYNAPKQDDVIDVRMDGGGFK